MLDTYITFRFDTADFMRREECHGANNKEMGLFTSGIKMRFGWSELQSDSAWPHESTGVNALQIHTVRTDCDPISQTTSAGVNAIALSIHIHQLRGRKCVIIHTCSKPARFWKASKHQAGLQMATIFFYSSIFFVDVVFFKPAQMRGGCDVSWTQRSDLNVDTKDKY